MTETLAGLVFLVLLAVLLWRLHRRTWARMGGHTPSPWDRSQRQNRRAAVLYREGRPQVQQARFARRRTINLDK